MSVVAKFVCGSVQDFGYSKTVNLSPVTDDGNPENKAFWEASPSGQLTLRITNKSASAFFAPQKRYYLEFREAE